MAHRFVMGEVRDKGKFCHSYHRLNGTTDIMIFILSINVQTGSVAHQASYLLRIGVLYQVYTGLSVLLTVHLHPMPRYKISDIHLQLPTYAFVAAKGSTLPSLIATLADGTTVGGCLPRIVTIKLYASLNR